MRPCGIPTAIGLEVHRHSLLEILGFEDMTQGLNKVNSEIFTDFKRIPVSKLS